ncbi:MAG: LAGLIDADG family homing endonuclease [Candidatus Omnitrophota bacterium]
METITWSNKLAYVVGLLTADGNLSPDGRHMTYVSKDRDLIQSFKDCLELKNKISRKTSGYSKDKVKRYYVMHFGNVRLYNFFTDIGLCPNKSKVLKTLLIPPVYFPDFFRGLIDGDGNIGYFMHPESRHKQFRIRIASGSRAFLEWLNTVVEMRLGVKGSIHTIKRGFHLSYYMQATAKIIDFIYYKKNVIALKRKRRIAALIATREWWNWNTRTA